MNAAQYGYSEVVKELLKNGANPYAENNAGKTAEALARDWGHKDVIAALSAVIVPAGPTPPRRKKATAATTTNIDIIISENVSQETPSALPGSSPVPEGASKIAQSPSVTPAIVVSESITVSINLETEPVSRNLP